MPDVGIHRNGQAAGAGDGPRRSEMSEVAGGVGGGRRCQNLILPIMPAMLVVSSLIVGAMVEEAR